MTSKKIHRYAAILLAAGMLLSACAKGAGGTSSEDSAKHPETESEGIDRTESGSIDGTGEGTSGETEASSDTEAAIRLLHPLINSKYRTCYNELGEQIETAEWESIEFQEDEAKEYPALAAAVREQFEQDEARLLQAMEDSRDGAEEYLVEMGADWGSCFAFERTVELQRCDSNVFSFAVLDYQFTGGAHGMYGWGGYSYDAKSGKLLTVEDIFTDKQKLAKAIEETLISMYSPDEFFNADSLLDSVTDYIDNGYLNVVLTNRGPRIYFNPYEIGPYAAGVLIANLYPENYPDLVKPEYAKTAESWIIKLKAGENIYVDIDGDYVPEDVRYEETIEYEDDYSYSRIVGYDIYAGARQLSVGADAYSSKGYFVRDREKSYLYLMQSTDNDYQILYAIDLTDGKLTFDDEACRLNAAVAVRDWNYDYDSGSPRVTEGYQCFYTLTDPQNMYLESRTDFLSTTSGNRMMHADECGVPVPNAGYEYYRIEHFDSDFTVRRAVTGTLIDEAGNEAGDYVLRAGESVRYVMTDNETFGDVRTADGKIVRLRMNLESWPHTIDGIELEEVFDGILFAG